MVRHRRAPGMQHGCDADPGAKVFGVGGDPDHGVRARPHQQIVDLAFVLVRDVGDRLWQREDQVEIPHRQKFRLTRGQPGLGRTRLTFWAMAITARIVGDMLMRAVLAPCNMPAKRCRAAALDCAHDLQLIEADMARIRRPPGSTMGTENIRDFQ